MHHIVDELLKRPLVMLVCWGIVVLIALHVELGDPGKKDVDFGAAIISGAAIVYSVLLSVQTRRTGSSARFMERWNGVGFTGARRDVRAAMRGEKTIHQVDEGHLVTLLNFFEEMSLSIQMGESHEPMLRLFFEGVVVRGRATFMPWIETQQADNPKAFEEYLSLVKRWSAPDGREE